eukprot:scaffold23262_cov78-Skeletonema_dohrnii-CCMP3373.AAC.2
MMQLKKERHFIFPQHSITSSLCSGSLDRMECCHFACATWPSASKAANEQVAASKEGKEDDIAVLLYRGNQLRKAEAAAAWPKRRRFHLVKLTIATDYCNDANSHKTIASRSRQEKTACIWR